MKLHAVNPKIVFDVTDPLCVTRGIERIFCHPFQETFRISKNEDFNGSYLENENEFFKNSFATVFRASEFRFRGQLVWAFQLTFKAHKELFSLRRPIMILLRLSLHCPTHHNKICQLQQICKFGISRSISKLHQVEVQAADVGLQAKVS